MNLKQIKEFEFMQEVTIEIFNGISFLLKEGIREIEIENFIKKRFLELSNYD